LLTELRTVKSQIEMEPKYFAPAGARRDPAAYHKERGAAYESVGSNAARRNAEDFTVFAARVQKRALWQRGVVSAAEHVEN
jgi:hypothetical protein